MTAWKDLERRICTELGGRRAGPIGAAVSDCVNVPYAVEVKRQKHLSLRHDHLEQARRQSHDEGKPWMLVLCEHGSRHPVAVVDFHWLADVLRRNDGVA